MDLSADINLPAEGAEAEVFDGVGAMADGVHWVPVQYSDLRARASSLPEGACKTSLGLVATFDQVLERDPHAARALLLTVLKRDIQSSARKLQGGACSAVVTSPTSTTPATHKIAG